MTKFSDLPTDCVQLIFERLSNTQLLFTARSVSRTWQHHQQLVCHTRKSLILLHQNSQNHDDDDNNQSTITDPYSRSYFDGSHYAHGIDQEGRRVDFQRIYAQNQLYLSQSGKFNAEETSEFLAENFPNLNSLMAVDFGGIAQFFTLMTNLVREYSSTLTTFKLYLHRSNVSRSDDEAENENLTQLVKQLNSLTSLEYLKLDCSSTTVHHLPPEELTFLLRVKELYCNLSSYELENWYDILVKNENLIKLAFRPIKIYFEIELPYNLDEWPLRDRLMHLPVSKTFPLHKTLEIQRYLSNFPSLHRIIPQNCECCSLTKFALICSKLSKLVHVSISLVTRLVPPSEPDPKPAPQLISVKALDLIIEMSHIVLNLNDRIGEFVQIFPNLESIRIVDQREAKYLDGADLVGGDQLKPLALDFMDQLKRAYGRDGIQTIYAKMEWNLN